MAHIRFTFYPGGTVKMEPQGYPGRTCYDATKSYARALNGQQTTKPVLSTATTINTVETPRVKANS